jgi:hypothetical protein
VRSKGGINIAQGRQWIPPHATASYLRLANGAAVVFHIGLTNVLGGDLIGPVGDDPRPAQRALVAKDVLWVEHGGDLGAGQETRRWSRSGVSERKECGVSEDGVTGERRQVKRSKKIESNRENTESVLKIKSLQREYREMQEKRESARNRE